MHQTGGREMSISELCKVFEKQVARMENLYLYYLSFIKELDHQGVLYDKEVRNKYLEASRNATQHLEFRKNPIIRAITDSEILTKKLEKHQIMFNHAADDNLVQKVYYDLKNSEFYKDYIGLQEQPGQHEELVLYIFKHYSENFQVFEQHFEDEFTNFLDDKKLVASMLKKTIQKIMEGKEDFLLEFIQDRDNTIGFGHRLIEHTVTENKDLHARIEAKIHSWEPGQIALIDWVIIKMGIAEFLFFDSIPSTVTINEYVELAKIGIVINDLQRSGLAYYLFKLFSLIFIKTDVAKIDGLISISNSSSAYSIFPTSIQTLFSLVTTSCFLFDTIPNVFILESVSNVTAVVIPASLILPKNFISL